MEVEGAQDWCLEEKMEGWQALVAIMEGVAEKHPQTAYTGLYKSLHRKWDSVQLFAPDIGTALQLVEDEVRDAFLREHGRPGLPQFCLHGLSMPPAYLIPALSHQEGMIPSPKLSRTADL